MHPADQLHLSFSWLFIFKTCDRLKLLFTAHIFFYDINFQKQYSTPLLLISGAFSMTFFSQRKVRRYDQIRLARYWFANDGMRHQMRTRYL